MAQKSTRVEVPVTLALDKSAYEKILARIPGEAWPAQKIAAVCDGLLADISDGGLMLSGEDMRKICEAIPGASVESIIEAVEGHAGVEDGQIVVKWNVDPAYSEPLANMAQVQGLTVNEVVQNLMDHYIQFAYDWSPEPPKILLTENEYEILTVVIGKKNFTGHDLLEYLKAQGVITTADSLMDLVGSAG